MVVSGGLDCPTSPFAARIVAFVGRCAATSCRMIPSLGIAHATFGRICRAL